jgi:hypothetical protein
MNERIKELILESVTFRLDPDSECYEAQVCPEDLEYLVELIVTECLMKAIGAKIRGESIDTLIQNIKEDFGVE